LKKPKEIRKRIKAVSNTKKITKTMEMIATSKLLKAQERVKSTMPYFDSLMKMLQKLANDKELQSSSPLMEERPNPKKVIIFLFTANRGLCGSYNANLIDKAHKRIDDYKEKGIEVELYIAGKRGISFFVFRNYEIHEKFTEIGDNPSYIQAQEISEILIRKFLNKEVDRVEFVFGHFQSMLKQPPTVLQLLPIEKFEEEKTDEDAKSMHVHYKFDPDAQTIMNEMIPLYINSMTYKVLVESVASEQAARRVAMKNATDNSEDLIRKLTISLNKSRQAIITNELTEIVGTAKALE